MARELSRPARGAWIEIYSAQSTSQVLTSRPARGAWIEMSNANYVRYVDSGRAPQGARGLKYG